MNLYELRVLKNYVPAPVGARGLERNAPEASAGRYPGCGDKCLSPPEEAVASLSRPHHTDFSAL